MEAYETKGQILSIASVQTTYWSSACTSIIHMVMELIMPTKTQSVLLATPARQIEHQSFIMKEEYGAGILYV